MRNSGTRMWDFHMTKTCLLLPQWIKFLQLYATTNYAVRRHTAPQSMHNHVQFSYGKKVRTKKIVGCMGRKNRRRDRWKTIRTKSKEFFQRDVRTDEENFWLIFNFCSPHVVTFCLVAILLTIYLMVVYCHYTPAFYRSFFVFSQQDIACCVSSMNGKIS